LTLLSSPLTSVYRCCHRPSRYLTLSVAARATSVVGARTCSDASILEEAGELRPFAMHRAFRAGTRACASMNRSLAVGGPEDGGEKGGLYTSFVLWLGTCE
jgi:hypothetical protein